MTRELIIDSFAGGGGASLGIAWALGRGPDIAINHDAEALAMHRANHPSCKHVREDVWHADLRKLVDGRPVGLLWLSPDCAHFSRAKGAVPVKKEIRSLPWIAVRWASQVRPRVIILENVMELVGWGPLIVQDDGSTVPCKQRKGMTFRLFVNRLRGLGYHVEWRNLNAADFGAPTKRRRLFLVARCDGQPIEWPEPTHGDPSIEQPLFAKLKPWRTAAECIDWSIPCRSIFDRPKPLAEKTLHRIALGMKRYVLETAEPFIVPITHNGKRRIPGIREPLPTITTANRGELALVAAFASKHYGGVVGSSCREPLGTITSRDGQALTAAVINRPGQHTPRCHKVYAFLAKYFGTAIGQPASAPIGTLTSKSRYAVVKVEVAPGKHEPAIGVYVAGVGPCVIVDIGMRMLQPRELARAQGFPDTYELTGTKTNQVAKIGNSVAPHVAAAVVGANVVSAVPQTL